MAVDRLLKQRVVIHGIDGEEIVPINADEESKTLAVNLQVYDPSIPQWIKMTTSMANDEFPVFYTEKFEWSAGNCIYKGGHATLNASIDDTAWHIYKYDYDGSNNCEQIRFSQGAWSNRTNLWT